MKAIIAIFGILMCFALVATLLSFFTETINQETPEILGHLIVIGFIIGIIYLCLKPSKTKYIQLK